MMGVPGEAAAATSDSGHESDSHNAVFIFFPSFILHQSFILTHRLYTVYLHGQTVNNTYAALQ